jgi:predicted NAD/FAD-binding protein
MKKPSPSAAISPTRRDAIKGASALGVAGLLGCGSAPEPGDASGRAPGALSGRPRVAVIGAGAGGIAAAYFLAGVYDVDLFEARPKIGGHCDSQVVEYGGERITVDLGAQFFHPATHPIYVTLLEEVGLYNPDKPGTDSTFEAPGSLCIFPTGGGWPLFSSTLPYLTPRFVLDFAIYSQSARGAVLGNLPWEVTLDDWISSLFVSPAFKESVLRPWIAALIGTTSANASGTSARSILQSFALAFPSNIFQGATTYNSKVGLEGNLQRILDLSPGARVHVNSQVDGLFFEGTLWSVRTPAGLQGPFDAVIVNAPPHTSKTLLQPLAWAGDVVSLLDTYEYFDSRILVHTDPAYAHRDRFFWSSYNAGIDGAECEGSAWLGPLHEKLASGATVDVFKSWAQRRRADPTNILLERRFKHPLITPKVIGSARALRTFQGRNGLYFSGAHTTGMDLQEAAVYSAMKVAEALAPTSASLASLRARLSLRGRAGVSYEL